jgi:hypothetical protein
MLDGSNPLRAWETLSWVEYKMPNGFFSGLHFCTHFPSLDERFLRKPDGPRVLCHSAPIHYGNRRAYSQYVIRELPKLVTAEHFMIIHRDGYPLNPEKWEDEFLKYDYIGAPWGPEPWAVGNGGFSIRSKRLAWWAMEQPWSDTENEDWHLCVNLRKAAIAAGFTFAPLEVAARFSLETDIPALPRTLKNVFGFHGVQNRLDLLL